jgi:hypothetical protein
MAVAKLSHRVCSVARITDEPEGSVGEADQHQSQEPAHQGDAGPRRPREDTLVAGEVPRREVAERADEVGDRPTPGGQNRADQQRGESLVGRAGEV